jgi:hypothetical protein
MITMSGALKCESCGNSPACKLKDDGFTDLCPENKPKRVIKTKEKSKEQFDLNKSRPVKKIQKSKKEKESKSGKQRVLKDMENGSGEPDAVKAKEYYSTNVKTYKAKVAQALESVKEK